MADNFTYYKGYEGEPEIVLSMEGMDTLHIWEGYFDDIYGAPSLDGKGWTGFTRDYQQLEGIFSNEEEMCMIEPTEYLADLVQYRGKAFDYEDTSAVFNLMLFVFERAIEKGIRVKAGRI
ncbi:MAG: hypothetical protein HDT27_01185 [Subdoligranulum sp.]|nr:hypothetical protein [Subdoligranulum sp.]